MGEKTAERIATLLVYLGALSIIVWALLKSLRIIQSPIWVEMVPYFGGGISLLALAYKAGKLMQTVEEIASKMKDVVGINERLLKLEARCEERHGKKR
ncbi:hypothetical protein HY991_01665 [Candidatus Micrarchaeota archaeon]|nr:hypothetical protein [Candidatus Micrarchaeota archaeon]